MVKFHSPVARKNIIHMCQRPFPKPPLVEPLPLDGYLNRTDRAEVGRSAFFHGRDVEFEVFRNAAIRLNTGDIGGGTMIFQGAPGAGKTALMQECMEAVRRHSTPDDPWVAVSIDPGTLYSPVEVTKSLIYTANAECERLSKEAPGGTAQRLNMLPKLGRKLYEQLSERAVGVAGISVGGKSQAGGNFDSTISAEEVFRNAAPLLEKFHLVIFVDEAQNTPVARTTRGVLDCLHRNSRGIPLVTAFFGLSDTQEVLRQCGLSRFSDERVVNMERLSMEDAAGSIRRMFDTYYTGQEEEKTVWVKALAELSQGWPQHINRVGVAAGRVIRTNKGQLERHLLELALEKGTERKNDYYLGRLAACSQEPELYKRLALSAVRHRRGILSSKELRRLAAENLEETQESFNDFLTNALHAGLLAPVARLPHHYQFPIPSLSDYLRALPVGLSNAV